MRAFGMETNIPELYSQDGKGMEATVYIHLISMTGWEFYITEYDGEETMFGYVIGFEREWGYLNYNELMTLIECNEIIIDYKFKPITLKEILDNRKVYL